MAQVPQAFNYEVVTRDAVENPMGSGTLIDVRFILKDQSTCGTGYIRKHMPTKR